MIEEVITYPASNSLEENVIAMAEHFLDTTESGHGLFFDFSNTPELEKPVLGYLTKGFGWTFDYNNTFIRKPE